MLQLPAWLENNANVAALGESWFGNQRGVEHALFILADSGLGSGVVVNESAYSGASGLAGEFSHMIVDINEVTDAHVGEEAASIVSRQSMRLSER